MPRSLQLCQNGGLSALSTIEETEKSFRGPRQAIRVGGDDSHVVLVKHSLVNKEVRDDVLS
jgi:hypothetical protein